jgi:arsenate reductase
MAEGWTRHLKGGLVDVYSAGIETHGLNPNAVRVMAEVGIDISEHQSEHIDKFMNIGLDYVVTVCDHAHETCPMFPGTAKIINAAFNDPPKMAAELAEKGASVEEQLECYRQVRDEIKEFVETIPECLS